jgi:hypothetical protein
MKHQITNQRELRREFWRTFPHLCHRRVVKFGDHRDYPCDTRCTFVGWTDALSREGVISQALSERCTL